jgi:hypothetical protein
MSSTHTIKDSELITALPTPAGCWCRSQLGGRLSGWEVSLDAQREACAAFVLSQKPPPD